MRYDGKYVSRFRAKPSGVLCAVLPLFHTDLLYHDSRILSIYPIMFDLTALLQKRAQNW